MDLLVRFTDGTRCVTDADCAAATNACINGAGEVDGEATGFECTSSLECSNFQEDEDGDGIGDSCDPCLGDPGNTC